MRKGKIKMTKELIAFVIDHLKHFRCYPIEYITITDSFD
jgi:hypothetical protein